MLQSQKSKSAAHNILLLFGQKAKLVEEIVLHLVDGERNEGRNKQERRRMEQVI